MTRFVIVVVYRIIDTNLSYADQMKTMWVSYVYGACTGEFYGRTYLKHIQSLPYPTFRM